MSYWSPRLSGRWPEVRSTPSQSGHPKQPRPESVARRCRSPRSSRCANSRKKARQPSGTDAAGKTLARGFDTHLRLHNVSHRSGGICACFDQLRVLCLVQHARPSRPLVWHWRAPKTKTQCAVLARLADLGGHVARRDLGAWDALLHSADTRSSAISAGQPLLRRQRHARSR